MQKFNSWRFIPLALLILMIASACSDLAGDVQIVETVAPQDTNSSQSALPLELPPNASDIANGQAIFAQNCTSCHGVNGAGDGELVESGEVPRMGSFLDPVHVRQQSLESYYDMITNGNLINLMPPWSGSLSLQERWDVAMYVYSLHYSEEQISQGEALVDNPSTDIQLASDNELAAETGLEGEDAYAAVAYQRIQSAQNWGINAADIPQSPQLESVNFSGVLSQGSPGATLPQGLQIQLQYGDFLDVTEVVDGVLDANGQFSFNAIPVLENSTYFAVAFYDERAFLSEQISSDELEENNAVDITLYETSNAPDMVNLKRMEFVMDYLTVPDLGTGIVIRQLNLYENPTDYVFHLEPEGQDIRISLLVSLPIGAVMLDAPEQNDFIPVPEQFALIDTRPVYPGEHFVETSYFIPYEGQPQTIDIRLNNQFTGEVSFIVTDPELNIIRDAIVREEDINLSTEDNPLIAKVYTGTVDYQAGESLIFDIEGSVSQNTSDDASLLTGDQLVPILAGVIIAVIALIAALMFYLRNNRNNIQREIDRLIMEISRLESQHDAGQINHDAFQQKRSELKARLAELMTESQVE